MCSLLIIILKKNNSKARNDWVRQPDVERIMGEGRTESGESEEMPVTCPGSKTCERMGKAMSHMAIHRLVEIGNLNAIVNY